MSVLVTDDSGYISSHTCLQLIAVGITLVIVDNVCNSKSSVVATFGRLSGHTPAFYKGDIHDRQLLAKIFAEHDIEAVIHFAGLKAVGESVNQPIDYYDNNAYGTLSLVEAMRESGVVNLIFSSPATVYGVQPVTPYDENLPTGRPASPYGRSKLVVEEILQNLHSMPIPAGVSACCATSIRSAPILPARWEKIRRGCPEQSDALYFPGRGGTSPLSGYLRQ